MKKITFKILLGFAILFSVVSSAQCLTAVEGLYPAATYTATTCDGLAVNNITTLGWASEYSNVTVTAGETYTFKSSIATDLITISNDDGVTATTFGSSPLTWVADITGTVRFYTHLDDGVCGGERVFRTRSFTCGIPPCIQPTVAFSKTSNCPDLTFNATADITDLGSATSITVTDDQGSAPQTVSAAGLITFGPYANGISVILTATNDQTPACNAIGAAQTQGNCPATNDNLANAEPVSCGSSYSQTTVGATLDEDNAPDGFGADMDAPNLWYSFTGSGFSETVTLNLCNSSYDTSVLVYTGTSGNLTLVAGNDDDATCGTGLTLRSRVNFTSDGSSTYLIAVEGYNVGSVGAFTMDVTCAGTNPPAVDNQTCATALAANIDGVDIGSDNSYGDVSPVQTSCDLFGSIQDVWFSFIAPVSGTVDCLLTPGTMTSANFTVYGGDCFALAETTTACNSNLIAATTESLTGLTAGNTYYVQVWSNAAEQGTFNLRLSDPSLGLSHFDSSSFKVFPNPVSNILNLSYDKEITNVSVFNLLGQEVMTKSLNSNLSQIDMSALSNGTYMIKVTADNEVKTIKIVKQ